MNRRVVRFESYLGSQIADASICCYLHCTRCRRAPGTTGHRPVPDTHHNARAPLDWIEVKMCFQGAAVAMVRYSAAWGQEWKFQSITHAGPRRQARSASLDEPEEASWARALRWPAGGQTAPGHAIRDESVSGAAAGARPRSYSRRSHGGELGREYRRNQAAHHRISPIDLGRERNQIGRAHV